MYAPFGLLQAAGIGIVAVLVVIIAIFIISVMVSTIKVIKEYERGVIFRLGQGAGRSQGAGPLPALPTRGHHGQDRLEDRHHGRPTTGRHNPR